MTVRVKRCAVKVALTDFAAVIVTVHVAPETVSHPLQAVKVDPLAGLAVRVTLMPLSWVAVQVLGQVIDPSLEVAVPFPVPARLTVRVKRCAVKVAVTDFAAVIVTVHVAPETVSHPLQAVKVDPLAGLAVRVTLMPLSKVAVQVLGQVIDPSLEVTVPFPVPARLTVRVKRCAVKVAVTDFAAVIVTVHVAPETVSHPLQAVKVDPLPRPAASVTAMPLS